MRNGLKQYFPMIQTREELCKKIQTTPELKFLFDSCGTNPNKKNFCNFAQECRVSKYFTILFSKKF